MSVGVEVVEVAPDDEAALRAWWEAAQVAARADRPHALLRTYDALRHSVRTPGPYFRRTLLAARDAAGATVGTAEVGLWRQGNDHLASTEVGVVPGHRRRGIGRALFSEVDRRRRAAGRSTLIGEVNVASGQTFDDCVAARFARAMGMRSVHSEHHLLLDLPVDEQRVTELRSRAAAGSSAYDVVTWGDRCPDEHVAAYCAMQTQMSADVPSGGLDVVPVVWDEERVRTGEERLAASYHSVVAAVRRRSDGVFGGYSVVYLPRGEDHALQDDTLVMPEHRGHRLGTVLKLATLDVLHRDHPERRTLHTWTEPDNHAMYRTNTDFGFVEVERMHEMQLKD